MLPRPLSATTTSLLAARRSIHRPPFLLSPIYDYQCLNASPHLKLTSLPHGCLSSLHHRNSRTYRVAPNSSTLRNCDVPRALILCSYAPIPIFGSHSVSLLRDSSRFGHPGALSSYFLHFRISYCVHSPSYLLTSLPLHYIYSFVVSPVPVPAPRPSCLREKLGAGSLRKRKPRKDKGKPRGPRKGKGKTAAATVDSDEDDGAVDSDDEEDQDNEGEKERNEVQPTPMLHMLHSLLLVPPPFDFNAHPGLQTIPQYDGGLGAFPDLPPLPTYDAGLDIEFGGELLQLLQAGMEEIAPSNGTSMGHEAYRTIDMVTPQITVAQFPGAASTATPTHIAGALTTASVNADPFAGGSKRKRPDGNDDTPPAKKPRKKRNSGRKDAENAPSESDVPERKVRKKRSDAGIIKGPRKSKTGPEGAAR
ncbi:hypothetical protein B0H13DRAFT_2523685 [Mycena leptocephala]|nr:hypothetical protein B0H13DRAFT_2523685 [Mycena leptocephala]